MRIEARDSGTFAAVAGTLALAAAAWTVTVHELRGMNMGVATELGSVRFFAAGWISMMAAMMLPGALPAIVQRVRSASSILAAPRFVVAYLAVWTAFGLVAYVLYRPHGALLAGLVTIAAALYELTPLKRACRLRCRASVASGSLFGVYCIGSSIGLMVVLLAVGAMSIAWMLIIATIVIVQKLLPPTPALDVPLALALAVLGFAIASTPASIPGIT